MKNKPTLKKSKNKMNSTYSVTYSRVITLGVVVALIVSALSISMIASLRQVSFGNDYINTRDYQNLNQRIDRLNFCYEQSVRPCDDASINKANASLTDDQQYSL